MRQLWIAAALWSAAAGWAWASPAGEEAERDWTVRDSIGVSYFVVTNPRFHGTLIPPGFREALEGDEVAVFSPDRQRFFFTSFHGDSAADEAVYELSVFSAKEVEAAGGSSKAPYPLRSVRFGSAHSDTMGSAGIHDPFWENDHSILFTGVNGRGAHRIYRLDVETGALTALSDSSHDVDLMARFISGPSSILYSTRASEEWKPLEVYPRAVVKGTDLWQIIEPKTYFERTYASYSGSPAKLVVERELTTYQAGPFLSPDGRWAVVITAPRGAAVPEAWQNYERRADKGYRFILINVQDGTTRSLIDAPAGTVTDAGRGRHVPFAAFWSSDSVHVLLYNTALPLNENREERNQMAYIVDYNVQNGRWKILQKMRESDGRRVGEAQWVESGATLFVRYETKGATPAGMLYRSSNHGWQANPAKKAPLPVDTGKGLSSFLKVSLRQDADTPPAVVAVGRKGEIVLTSPDPAVTGVWRAKARPVEWDAPEGRRGRGILFLPRATRGVAPWPLIIEVAGYEPDVFRPDGGTSSGYATQALVAKGFAVLRLDRRIDGSQMTPHEGTDFIANVDAAVDSLGPSDLIDRGRVGMIGHSRTGYLTHYMVSHAARTQVAAAVVCDSITAGYTEYIEDPAFGEEGSEVYEKQYGEGTFWQNKSGWMDAPLFNTDRVMTPMLFSAAGQTNASSLIETVGAFRINRRPFEYHFYSAGAHNLQRPREREAAMQSTVDWMSFWILGQPPTAPADDADRPARWGRMKRDWENREATQSAIKMH